MLADVTGHFPASVASRGGDGSAGVCYRQKRTLADRRLSARRRPSVMTLETRAKIATVAARCFGATMFLAGVAALFFAATEPSGRLALLILGAPLTILGAAFFLADAISSEDLDSSKDGLSMLAHIMQKRRAARNSGKR
jgi:hypothetical protein